MAEIDGGTWWWTVAGSAQLVAGLAAYRRGSGGSSTMMPFKAFGVASLFVGSASCAVAGVLHASGIRQVEFAIQDAVKLYIKKLKLISLVRTSLLNFRTTQIQCLLLDKHIRKLIEEKVAAALAVVKSR